MTNVAFLTVYCVPNLGTRLVVTDGELRVPVCPALSPEAYVCCIFRVGSLVATLTAAVLEDQDFPSGFNAFHRN